MSRIKNPKRASRIHHRGQHLLDRLRHQSADIDALPLLTLLGLLCALAAALIIMLFRGIIDLPITEIFGVEGDNFEALEPHWYFLLPVIGGVILATLLHFTPPQHRQTSVVHVLERLHNHQGRMPFGNWLMQFVGGAIALMSGQSVGREGPAVHLGAGAASLLGQHLKLPNNSLRILIGCGIASAIAASFNTPMAGVIFAMEVILFEYTIAGFIPIILASVTGAAISQAVFGPEPAFSMPESSMNTLLELPTLVIFGVIIAFFSAAFMRLQLWYNRQSHRPIALRILFASTVTGIVAFFVPQILGFGYDTIESTMRGDVALSVLLLILLAKLFITTLTIGLGMPGGLIGPILFIGAILGASLGLVNEILSPVETANPSFYVMLGMAGMMAAILNAPLTALITVLELTYNPHIIFPTMLVVVVAVLCTRQLFRCEGIFVAQLEANGFDLSSGPIRQALNRIGVRRAMDISFLSSDHCPTLGTLRTLLQHHPRWLVVDGLENEKFLLAAADMAAYVDSLDHTLCPNEPIDLLEAPGRKWLMEPVSQQASLFDAKQLMDRKMSDAIYIERQASPVLSPVLGILTREHISNYYR